MNNKNGQITETQAKSSISTRKRTRPFTRADWLVPTALIVLSVIPFLGGIFRLVVLAGGAEVTPENARFFAIPLPVVLHIITALPFCILGAFQFAPALRRRRNGWHRLSGRLLVLCGLAAGLSGLWMTQFYPLYPNFQNNPLYVFRMLAGSIMVISITLGLVAILKRDISRHRAWMIRGYAMGQGAGTQALISLFWVLTSGTPDAFTHELLMGASWAINLALAEWIIRRKSSKQLSSSNRPLPHRSERSIGDDRAERSMAHVKVLF